MAQLILLHEWKDRPLGHVIFVHGLGGDAHSTWKSASGEYWYDWIAEDHPGLAVWTYSYSAPMLNWFGNALPLQDAADAMLTAFRNEPKLDGLPIAFVCHSLGGLMVKQLLRHANDRQERLGLARDLVEKTCGILFAATPHHGSGNADLLGMVGLVSRPSAATKGLEKNNAHLRDLNRWYRDWDRVYDQKAISHLVLVETEKTGGFRIVDQSSADVLAGAEVVHVNGRHHIDIVKPEGRETLVHKTSSRFLRESFTRAVPPGRLEAIQRGQAEAALALGEAKAEILAAIAGERGVEPRHLQPLFEAVGQDVPSAQFEHAIRAAVEALLEKSRDKVEPMNDGLAVLEAIGAARARLAELDAEGAVDVLDRAIAEKASVREAATKGEARLLAEKADIFAISYQWDRALQALARAAELEPDDAWHRFRSGDIHVHQGRLTLALAEHEAGGAAARLSGDDRDLSVSHERIGGVRVAQGDLAGGLAAYEAGLAIRQRLAGSDPSNSGWQRDLSVSHNKIGDVRVAQGDLAGGLAAYEAALAIRQNLAGSDPSNSGWQRDLSVSHSKIGDLRVAQGDLAGALAAYEAGLAIADRLAGADPSNSGWQRDLSVSHDKIGDVRVAQGDLAGALAAYEAGLAIRQNLAGSDASNSGWQRDLIVSHVKLAEAGAEPMAHFQAALKIARKLMQEGRLAPVDHFIPGMLEDRLTALRGE